MLQGRKGSFPRASLFLLSLVRCVPQAQALGKCSARESISCTTNNKQNPLGEYGKSPSSGFCSFFSWKDFSDYFFLHRSDGKTEEKQ